MQSCSSYTIIRSVSQISWKSTRFVNIFTYWNKKLNPGCSAKFCFTSMVLAMKNHTSSLIPLVLKRITFSSFKTRFDKSVIVVGIKKLYSSRNLEMKREKKTMSLLYLFFNICYIITSRVKIPLIWGLSQHGLLTCSTPQEQGTLISELNYYS